MAYQVGPACYATAEAANSAIASTQAGTHLAAGGAAYVVGVTGVTPSSITYSYAQLGGATTEQTYASMPQPCGLLDYKDGLNLGWGVGLAYLSVYALLFMTRGLRHGDA